MITDEIFQKIMQEASAVYSEEGLRARLYEGKPLKIKFGADPTRPDLHIGHSVSLRMLRLLQSLGHSVVFVIGDYTAMIGDPSGKSKTREPMTFEKTRENAQSYYEQVTKILDPLKTVITFNSTWFSKMDFKRTLELAGKYTLAQLMQRDDFSNRYKTGAPIGVHELLYPLMQGYDSVELGADIEVGGTDQTFNLLVGRELQRDYGQRPQEVVSFELLPGLDGAEKMSKSLNNYIGITEAPEIMFEKAMRVPDTLLEKYFRLTTGVSCDEYGPLLENDMREAHFMYARELVRMYHGQAEVLPARERYEQIASGGLPESMEEYETKAGETLCAVLAGCALAVSKSDARRLVAGNGIKMDGIIQTNPDKIIKNSCVLSKGKSNFIKITIVE